MVVTDRQVPRDCFELPSLAPAVGPFPFHGFLSAWWEELAPGGEIMTVCDGRNLLPMHRLGSTVAFMGDDDHTDYHSPLGTEPETLLSSVIEELGHGIQMSFDSMPLEASGPVAGGLAAAGLQPKVTEQVVAMVLELPTTVEGFMEVIGKKVRHELRRKRRRYQEQIGPVVHTTHTGVGFGFDEFVRLHRLAPGDKGDFITGKRLGFFARLAAQPGWRVDLLEGDGVATACLFGWTDGDTYYLYNSSFEPSLQAGSPGLVLLLSMIEHAINQGWGRFDFLKGNEPYKTRMGARPRQLYRVEATT